MSKILSFNLRNELYGIDITKVREMNRNISFTPVPRTNENIVGIFNMRGQIVTLFDLAKILGYEEDGPKDKQTCLILKDSTQNPELVGFLIDKPGDVFDISPEQCEPPPGNVDESGYRFIESIARLEEVLVRIISPEKIVEKLS